jgi:hypothetical protein
VGKRSRKRRGSPSAPVSRPRPKGKPAATKPAAATTPASTRAARSEAKNQAVRDQLVPLEPGERPLPVTIGAFVAVGLIVANVIVYVTGLSVRGDRPALIGFIAFGLVMVAMAWGLWRVKYWAVLGLQALLGLLLVIFGLVALTFSSATDVLICVAVILPAGTLFWFLVKAMARIQMPKRPERSR